MPLSREGDAASEGRRHKGVPSTNSHLYYLCKTHAKRTMSAHTWRRSTHSMMRSIRSLVGFEAYPTSRCFRLQRGPIARKIGKRLRMPLKKLHLETPVITYLCILHVSQLCSLRLREEQRLLLD